MKSILLIVSGGIAAYKSLELVRLARKQGIEVTAVLTEAGAQFVTPLSLQALTENQVYTNLFSLTDEHAMGHIALSRAADLVVAAPASADFLAKMATGQANDLATTLLLATNKPILVAPAMNVKMWQHPATIANIATLRARGVTLIGPEDGEMACHDYGPGRMSEPATILAAILASLHQGPLRGHHAIVTSGPTFEPIDPVRYIANRSSGKQGHAIAAALVAAGARVTLVSGPVALPDPAGCDVIHVETASQMLAAVEAALPADIAICVAAVADWRPESVPTGKIKKSPGQTAPTLSLAENPDILATLAAPGPSRPRLVIGFAAETDDLLAHATQKRLRKGCDWLLANHVGIGSNVLGADRNQVHLITSESTESWPPMAKTEVAAKLATLIAGYFS